MLFGGLYLYFEQYTIFSVLLVVSSVSEPFGVAPRSTGRGVLRGGRGTDLFKC
jgi:hypothetical protein